MKGARGASARQLALPLIISSLFSLTAKAEISDTIHPFVGGSITYDDNLLRQDKDAVPAGEPLSDTYRSTIVGVEFEREIGRQKLTGTLKASKVDFNRFTSLNYTGKDATVNLDWALAGHLSGKLGGTYSESLASFSDFHTATRNLRSDKRLYFKGDWRFHPSWRLHAGYATEDFHFDAPGQSYNNRTEDTSEAGFDFLQSSGSSFGLLFKRLKGRYPDTVIGTTIIDNGYVQDSANININWLVSGVTQVTFLGGRARRRHNTDTLRDQSGNNGRLIVNWAPRERLQFSASAWREFGVAEGLLINSALSTGTNVTANWIYSPKVSFNGQIQNEKREFSPLRGVDISSGLTDRTHTANLGVNYLPWQQVQLGLSAFVNNRSGSLAAFTNSFHAKGVSFNAVVNF